MVTEAAPAGVHADAERHRSAAVDSLRAVAALSVLAFHASQIRGAPGPANALGRAFIENLDTGLVLFFVLSGYLITGPFVRALVAHRPLPPTRAYLLRRACRIVPAFWVALAAVGLLLPRSQSSIGAQGITAWWQVPVHALLLPNLVPGQFQTMLKVDWTLENELVFYVAVPLAALLLVRRTARITPERLALMIVSVWSVSALASFGAQQLPLFTDGSATARYTIPSMAGFFCPGILVAIALSDPGRAAGGIPGAINALLRRRELALAVSAALLLGGVGVYEASVRVTHPYFYDLRWQPFGAAFGIVLGLAVTSGARVHRVTRLLAPVGLVSYGLYLWHPIVIRLLDEAGFGARASDFGTLAWPINALLVLALTLPPASASWLLVERPALRWAAERAARSRPPRGGISASQSRKPASAAASET